MGCAVSAGIAVDECDDGAGKSFRAFAAFGEGFGEGAGYAERVAEGANLVEFFAGVVREVVDGDEGG